MGVRSTEQSVGIIVRNICSKYNNKYIEERENMILDVIVEDKKKRLPEHKKNISEEKMKELALSSTRKSISFYDALKKDGLSIIGEFKKASPSHGTMDNKIELDEMIRQYSSSADAASEFRELVHTLHENGMECVMEFYFAPGMNQNVILDALRFWVREYHVDGFHLQGDSLPVTAAAQDLLLSRTKLFYTHFDPILLENAKKYHHLYVYSDEYLYPARKMLNHMEGNLNEFFCQQRKQNSVEGFVNYITNNNGFTLWDLFSYCEKHNLENGEDNCDGNSFNYSSNCGVEGNTRKRYIDNLRKKQVRNALAMEFLAQGVPLVLGGDEFLNSQQGNNNAYCQDNKTGWLNWKKQKKETWLAEFIKNLADFRREHPIIASEHPMELNDYGRKGFPDLSYHGESAWISSIPADRQAAGILYCGEYEKKTDQTPDDYIYIGYNFHSGLSHLALPKLPQNKKWYLLMTTAAENSFLPEKEILEDQHLLAIEGQSINIVIGI